MELLFWYQIECSPYVVIGGLDRKVSRAKKHYKKNCVKKMISRWIVGEDDPGVWHLKPLDMKDQKRIRAGKISRYQRGFCKRCHFERASAMPAVHSSKYCIKHCCSATDCHRRAYVSKGGLCALHLPNKYFRFYDKGRFYRVVANRLVHGMELRQPFEPHDGDQKYDTSISKVPFPPRSFIGKVTKTRKPKGETVPKEQRIEKQFRNSPPPTRSKNIKETIDKETIDKEPLLYSVAL